MTKPKGGEMSEFEMDDIDMSVGYLLRIVNQKAREKVIKKLSQYGLSSLELTTLFLISLNQDCSLSDLAKASHLSTPPTNRVVNSLVTKGMVSRRKSMKDARFVHIRTTETGESTMKRSKVEIMKVEQQILDKLEPEYQLVFMKSLRRLKAEL